MSLIINQLSYRHPDKEMLFQNISFSISKGEKTSVIGDNGTGKSTLLKILTGELKPENGEIISKEKPFYVPQHFGQYNELTVAEVLNINRKISALHHILAGEATGKNFEILNDDWTIEERALSALSVWGLSHVKLFQQMDNLSGGEKTKVFLSGIDIHSPAVILMDEPTNHLDKSSRNKLYELVKNMPSTVIVVSHDRALLSLMPVTYELSKNGIERYGGNYKFYKEQKEEKTNAIQQQLNEKEKELRKAKKIALETIERQKKHSVRGEKNSSKKGIPRIALNNLQSKSENSMSKLKNTHAEKTDSILSDIKDIQQKLSGKKRIKINFENSKLHKGKILVEAKKINFGYKKSFLWKRPLTFEIRSGERWAIKGRNGSGKTTLIKLIFGNLKLNEGIINRTDFNAIYIDQEYSIIENRLTILEQVEKFNKLNYNGHEIKILLHRFQFPLNSWDKKCNQLSGGEKMKLLLCCLQVNSKMPDIIALDEPANNLDIQSMEILSSVIKSYLGTVIIISHDEYFLNEIGVNKEIQLEQQ